MRSLALRKFRLLPVLVHNGQLLKWNHNHDERGRFATSPGAANPHSLSDWNARQKMVNDKVAAYLNSHGDTKSQNMVNGQWTPERAKLHEKLLSDQMKLAASVPKDHLALFMGGLPGSGKSSIFRGANGPKTAETLGVTLNNKGKVSNFMTIDADVFKESLVNAGATPKLPGLAPLEMAGAVHKESAYLANTLVARLTAQGTNTILDRTMTPSSSSAAGVKEEIGKVNARITDLSNNGYKVTAVFVSVTPRESMSRSASRWRETSETFVRTGQGNGGRIVPTAFSNHALPSDRSFRSSNEQVFASVRDHPALHGSFMFDNMVGFGEPPKLINSRGMSARKSVRKLTPLSLRVYSGHGGKS